VKDGSGQDPALAKTAAGEWVPRIAFGDLEDGTHAQPDPRDLPLAEPRGARPKPYYKMPEDLIANHMRNDCICVLL